MTTSSNSSMSCEPISLFEAAKYGDVATLSRLIAQGSKVNEVNKDGASPLLLATLSSSIDAISFLLDQEADIKAQTRSGFTPLLIAAQTGDVEVLSVLISHGANLETQTSDGWTPLMVAAQYDRVNVVDLLISHKANVNACSKENWTPVMVAAQKGHVNIIKLLIWKGANIHTRNNYDFTPLIIAAAQCQDEAVSVLISHGADVNARTEKGHTALIFAALKDRIATMELLLSKHADVNSRYEHDFTAILALAQQDDAAAMSLLISHGADINDTSLKNGWTPLMLACQSGFDGVISVLLEQGANVDCQDKTGWTALLYAAQDGHTNALNFLIAHGGDVELRNNNKQTALMTAVSNNQLDAVNVLLKHGAKINVQDKDKNSTLIIATDKGNVDVIRELLTHGADISACNNSGKTAIDIALERDDYQVKALLIGAIELRQQGDSQIQTVAEQGEAGKGSTEKRVVYSSAAEAGNEAGSAWGDENGECGIELGAVYLSEVQNDRASIVAQEHAVYKPHEFVRNCLKQDPDWLNQLNQITIALLDKVTIHPDQHCEVSNQIETVVERICRKLPFDNINVIKTGSFYNDLKVGLPYEADFILDIPAMAGSDKDLQNFLTELDLVLKTTRNLEGKISGKFHHRAGACLALEITKDGVQQEGVTIDLVPVCEVSNRVNLRLDLRPKAASFLESLNLDVHIDGNIYRLLTPLRDHCYDTGVLIDKILAALDEGKRSGFRAAKYILQNVVGSKPKYDFGLRSHARVIVSLEGIRFASAHMSHTLYGLRPLMKSFYLRLCFLHLLINTHNTETYEHLTGGVLALCLLDMMHKCVSNSVAEATNNAAVFFSFKDPLIKDERLEYRLYLSAEQRAQFTRDIHVAMATYLDDARATDISRYNLLNYPKIKWRTNDFPGAIKTLLQIT